MHLLMRIFGELLLPPFSLMLMVACGVLLMPRYPRLGRVIALVPVPLLFLLSLPIISLLLGGSTLYLPYRAEPFPPADAIVILGGGRRAFAPEYEQAETLGCGSLERLRYGVRLARRYGLPILVTGGKPHMGVHRGEHAEGDLMRALLEEEYGQPVKWVENQSDDTNDNVRLSAPLLRADGVRRIYLVTHAWHAERASQLFSAEGFEVIATPTVFYPERKIEPADFIPSFGGLASTRALLYDWINRLRPR
jgi:uncharacterized SAM-binding protein YcdF (DUF218 family)